MGLIRGGGGGGGGYSKGGGGGDSSGGGGRCGDVEGDDYDDVDDTIQ